MVDLNFLIFFLNVIISLIIVFYKPRDISTIWAWLLVLFFLPYIGIFLYFFFGRGLSQKDKLKISKKEKEEFSSMRLEEFNSQELNILAKEHRYIDVINFISSVNHFPITSYDSVKLFNNGEEKLTSLLHDIEKAEKSIYIEYYAFVTDEIGQKIVKLLEKKALQGVEVRLMYDAFGSLGTKKSNFKKLIKNGGFVETFFTSRHALLEFKLNYHNHRKIVVIDEEISYVGGFNIAEQYVYVTKKFGFWRDTHARITGPISSLLQMRFTADWNISATANNSIKKYPSFESIKADPEKDSQYIQVVSSGPNNDHESIKLTFIKLITTAKKRVWIQTPYLVPDESIISALKIAKGSGVDVKIMIPDKPDHPFIYRATQYYARQLAKENIDILIYNGGFLHAKTMIVDDDISMVGSANQDIRSYKLNFETSVVIYNNEVNENLTEFFIQDCEISEKMDEKVINQMSLWLTFKQKVSRLFSPIL